MKNLYPYHKFITEGVRDKMTPVSDDDARKRAEKMTPKQKIDAGVNSDVLWLVEDGVKNLGRSRYDFANALKSAANSFYIDIVKYFIDNNLVKKRDVSEALHAVTSIHYNIDTKEKNDIVKLLKDTENEMVSKSEDPTTLLHYGCDKGNYEYVKRAIEMGVKLNKSDESWGFYTAVNKGYKDIVQLLIDNGVSTSSQYNSAIKSAIKNNDIEMVELLVKNGIDIDKDLKIYTNEFDIHLFNDITKWIIEGSHKEVVKYLANNCESFKTAMKNHINKLNTHIAKFKDISEGRVVRLMEDNTVRGKMTPKSKEKIDADLRKLSPNKKIDIGFEYELPWLMELGIREGGSFSPESDVATLIFNEACFKGNFSLVEAFLEEDIDVDLEVGLESACVAGHEKIVNLLLDKGANPNYFYGRPLKAAAENGNLSCVELLLVHGAEMKWATSYIEKLPPNVKDYLLKYKRSSFFRKIKDKIRHTFTNEGIRDKMTPKSEEEVNKSLDKILEGDYDTILKSITNYLMGILGMNYPDEVYSRILREIDFTLLKEHIGDIVESVIDNKFVGGVIGKHKTEIKDIKTYLDLFEFVFNIGSEIGDVHYRDEILRRLIKLNDLDKTKAIIKRLITHGINESVRDKMTPVPKEDILGMLNSLSKEELIVHLINKFNEIYFDEDIRLLFDTISDELGIDLYRRMEITEEDVWEGKADVTPSEVLDFLTVPELRKMFKFFNEIDLNESIRDKMTPISEEDLIKKLLSDKSEEEAKHFLYLTQGLEKFLNENNIEYSVNYSPLNTGIPSIRKMRNVTTAIYNLNKSKIMDYAWIYMNEYKLDLELHKGKTFNIIHPKNLEELIHLLIEQGFVIDENQ